jgi:hypothetical protein
LNTLGNDLALISDVIATYVEGARTGKGSVMRPAFREDATIFGFVGDTLLAGPIEQLFDWNDANGPAKDVAATVAAIDVAGTVACARVELANWTGHRYTDVFTLLKDERGWRITQKAFHAHAS